MHLNKNHTHKRVCLSAVNKHFIKAINNNSYGGKNLIFDRIMILCIMCTMYCDQTTEVLTPYRDWLSFQD